MKATGNEDVFRSAAAVVDEHRNVTSLKGLALGDRENFIRIVNRAREVERPQHPKDKEFQVTRKNVCLVFCVFSISLA